MKLIIGLGNPGRVYIDSRHNIGSLVVRALARAHQVSFKRDKNTFCLSVQVRMGGQIIILAIPLTLMNSSGRAVKSLLKKYKIDLPHSCTQERGLDNLLVVCDDLDLELGRLKLRPFGSSGGHRGLKSIIDSLGSQDFCRLRIGIGRAKNINAARYVLSRFTRKEKEIVKAIIERAVNCCQNWIKKGVAESMNIFNPRINKE